MYHIGAPPTTVLPQANCCRPSYINAQFKFQDPQVPTVLPKDRDFKQWCQAFAFSTFRSLQAKNLTI